MPKNKTSDPSKTLPNSEGRHPDDVPERTDWDRKLSEARAKRAEVLSARAQADPSQETAVSEKAPPAKRRSQPKPTRERVSKTPKAQPVPDVAVTPTGEAARVKFNLTDANALKALFVFCGAAGFGIGTVVGFGILVGMGGAAPTTAPSLAEVSVDAEAIQTLESSTSEQIAQVSASDPEQTEVEAPAPAEYLPMAPVAITNAEIFTPTLPFEINAVAQPLIAEEPVTPALAPGVVQALPDMLDKDIGSFDDPDGQVSLPNISNVRYMRDDLPKIDAVYLRSLPEIDTLHAASFPAVEASDPEPEFYMHAPDGLSDAQLRRFISQLESKGVVVSKIGREGFRVSTTHLRYYSPETAEVAAAVAADLGVPARDFSQNAQISDRIEVWVAGSPKPVEEIEETSKGVFYWLGQGRREER